MMQQQMMMNFNNQMNPMMEQMMLNPNIQQMIMNLMNQYTKKNQKIISDINYIFIIIIWIEL